jgi:serine protease Do
VKAKLGASVASVAFGLVCGLSVVSGCGRGSSGSGSDAGAPSAPLPAPTPAPPPAASPVGRPPGFADLAAQADPAVVFVRTLRSRGPRQDGEGYIGTAFVFDAEGLILTNYHVVEGATEIRVAFSEERELVAKIVGSDPPTDIAVLRVEEKGLAHLPLGDSDALRVGDWVVAIGNPFGLSHTVSAGIVSAKGRTSDDLKLGDGTGYYNFIQTDASINLGNSGGPLLDANGNVVGINTAMRARANSIGFAIPINMVKELLPRLIKDGKLKRSAIGIVVLPLGPADPARLGLSNRHGALVQQVLAGGAADRAGLKAGDVILGFAGEEIRGPERLRWLASVRGIGEMVSLKVKRGSRTFELQLRLDPLPE